MSWMKARMGHVSRQRRHSWATLDWECLIRTVARNLPETDHNRQAVHRPERAPLNRLTLGAAEHPSSRSSPNETPCFYW